MTRNTRNLLTIAALALAVGAVTPAVASAAHVGCGSVITTNTVLDSNVGPCLSDGLIIGADNITLDLNAKTVSGLPLPGDGNVGIRLTGRRGVLVKNGTVTTFDAGVVLEGSSTKNKVSGVTARDNIGTGLGDWGDGIAILDSSSNQIVNNAVIHNGPFDGIGVFGASTANKLMGNTVRDNNVERDPTNNQDDGIRLEPGTSGSIVTKNTVTGSGLDGIAVFARSTDNSVNSNTVTGNGFHNKTHRKGDGIRVFLTADRTIVQGNSSKDNAANGIRVDSQSNQILTNRTAGNNAAPNPAQPAFDLFDSNTTPPCDANVWSGNTFVTFNQPCVTG
ncbi:MAG: right-handed parallel beta-helix repeat-containing protein [Solirubrobacterales bacterium]|nr:right-handed parallel beta-helix repeat-containing protein [Solirubrobacterales bacterium]